MDYKWFCQARELHNFYVDLGGVQSFPQVAESFKQFGCTHMQLYRGMAWYLDSITTALLESERVY